jgi:tripartite-type tricarboxylate transporter receptor subunit TctC
MMVSAVKIRVNRREWVAGLSASLAGLSLPRIANAQTPDSFPNRSLRIVVPYAPGGTADILGRLIAERLTASLGQTVIVENRVGAGTAIASRFVATSPADGYTLMIGTITSHAMNPALQPDIGYDPVKDFSAISAISDIPYLVVANPLRGFTDLAGLIKRARAEPGKLTYGSAGAGSSNHLAAELFAQKEGLSLTHVPYRGSAPALNDVLAGQIDFMFDLLTTSQAHVKAGTLQGLATTAPKRIAALADVPTTAEIGIPDLAITSWFGVFAPAGVPEPILHRLSDTLAAIITAPDIQQKLAEQGGNPLLLRDKAFEALVAKDYRQWAQVVRTAGITQTIK